MFARIHRANLINFGVVPLIFEDGADYDYLAPGQTLKIPGLRQALQSGQARVAIMAEGRRVQAKLEFSPRERDILLAGGVLNYAKSEAATGQRP